MQSRTKASLLGGFLGLIAFGPRGAIAGAQWAGHLHDHLSGPEAANDNAADEDDEEEVS